ncbi:OsmC family protein [Streptomyces ipomoeae]|uniref:OsmC-like protein n=1 Tax=Streptomyces ipomoeae 91-03 TaxID=698759 RepID=L1KWS4_9ACTN|nr:OsmC family protein [Streptomyces ipomoeae]EKX65077.1 OsmC-like protein [Streptomyces ipomoeae 91-03]MDX2693626.1 OsmC family protein [Streptomyces ipomoeae]MDX2824702.1 OsmC family protein [Streptomyces ipomoeae]MDX2838125.1 OsmC family protein [Streptomyces ipomoeae]MDX2877454.1 OsmC family protein [Streptomyces ipomoeae]
MPVVNEIDVNALNDTIDAVRTGPKLGQVTFAVDGSWQGGCRLDTQTGALAQGGELDEKRVAQYTMSSDEPAALLGTDTAVSPGEYLLQALAGCYTVTIATLAAAQGIALKSLRLELEGDVDLRGFLGITPSIRPGLGQVRVHVHAEAPDAPREQLEELIALVESRSPIRDTIGNPVDVVTTLA